MPRGRRPKPKRQLKLVGTFRNDRHGDSPDPPRRKADCPPWLHGKARALWPQITELLAAMRLDSTHYTLSIVLLCDSLADFIHFSKLARKKNPVEKTAAGNAFQNPIFGLKNGAWERVLKSCREFGMTPAALRGIEIPQGLPVDELDEVLA